MTCLNKWFDIVFVIPIESAKVMAMWFEGFLPLKTQSMILKVNL